MDAFFSSLALDPWASVPRFPAPQEYFRVLEAIARDSETVTSEQLNLVVKVPCPPPSSRHGSVALTHCQTIRRLWRAHRR